MSICSSNMKPEAGIFKKIVKIMFGPEYAAYKHILEDELTNIHNDLNRKDYPAYLFPKKFNIQDVQHKKSYTDDFILISEFSEIEGPKPLLTIPTDGGIDFNKNDYALHLMCVDFHIQQQSQQNDMKFGFTKDTSIINYWDTSSGHVAAYIHHFTLYDIEARGFVRPFCIAYITYERHKIQTYYHRLYSEFTKITDIFKQSNLNQFRNDLTERLDNLKYTCMKYDEWHEKIFSSGIFTNDLVQHENALIALELNKRIETKFLKFSGKQSLVSSINETEMVLNIIQKEIIAKNWSMCETNGQACKYTTSLSQTSDSSSEINRQCVSNVNRCDESPTDNHTLHATNSRPRLILDLSYSNINNRRNSNYQHVLKSIDQLALHTSSLAFRKLRQLHKHYSTPIYLLKYKDLERNTIGTDQNRPMHSAFWSFSMGDCFLYDFSNKIEIMKYNECKLCELQKTNRKFTFSSDQHNGCAINDVCADSKLMPNECVSNDVDDHQDLMNVAAMSANDENDDDSDWHLDDCRNLEKDYDFGNTLISRFKLNSLYSKTIIDLYLYLNEFNFECMFRTVFNREYSSFFVHMLYSILKGRTIIILSHFKKNYNRLELIVNYLSFFVPNSIQNERNSRGYVIYERKQIRFADLKFFKIIGLSLDYSDNTELNSTNDGFLKYIPITIENYISVLDMDRCTFRGPKYAGTYLTQICTRLKSFPDDSTSYLYVIQRLYIYVRIAFLYTHIIDSFFSVETTETSQSPTSSASSSLTSLFSTIQAPFEPAQTMRRNSNSSFTQLLTQFQIQANDATNQLASKPKLLNKKNDEVLAFFASILKYSCIKDFSQSDLNIVFYLVKSYRLKQVYLINKQAGKCFDDLCVFQINTNDTASNSSSSKQIPVLVEYDDVIIFNG